MSSQNRNTSPAIGKQATSGLPSHLSLCELAKTYLTEQHRHFPDFPGRGLLPELEPSSYDQMAEFFVTVYTGAVSPQFTDRSELPVDIKTGACYVRYSDTNSNSRSLDQQLINVLKTARSRDVFIPWSFVFADAALTATTAERPGYKLIKALVSTTEEHPQVIFVDELDRLHRDQEESIRFRKVVSGRQRQLVTSNGFDSSNEFAKIAHTMTALQSEMYIDQLTAKVDRGMIDAFKNGKHVSGVPTGYKLKPRMKEDGQPVANRNGKLVRDVVIDEEGAKLILRIFQLYAQKKESPQSIARILDQEQALGRSTWGASSVSQILKNEKYIGHWKWKKTRKAQDPITGKKRTVKNLEKDQLTRFFSDRQIISDELWKATREREKDVSRDTHPADKKQLTTRQEAYPNMLFNLHCEDCGKPLQRYRSHNKNGKKYIQLHCPNGKSGLRGCNLASTKSLKIIEECILTHVKQHLFADGFAEQLCIRANAFIQSEADKPRTDTSVLSRRISTLNTTLGRSGDRLARLGDGVAADRLMDQIRADEAELKQTKLELERTTKSNFRPAPIEIATIRAYLAELGDLMRDDVVAAHQILSNLVGRVYVSVGTKQGRTHTWMARLSIDPIAALVEIGRTKDCPTTHSLEYLRECSWTMGGESQVDIRDIPNHERIAAQAIQMRKAGSTISSIAVALKVDHASARRAIQWGAKNDFKFIPSADFSVRRKLPNSKTESIGPEVVRLREVEGMSFERIAVMLKTAPGTVSRAYKQFYTEKNHEAVSKGEVLSSGPIKRKINPEIISLIRELLQDGKMSKRAIARQANVTPWTVRHEAKRIASESSRNTLTEPAADPLFG